MSSEQRRTNLLGQVHGARAGRLVDAFHMVTPGLYLKLLPPFFERGTCGREPPHTPGNLYEPQEPSAQVGGGWERRRRLPKRLAAAGTVVAVPLGILLLTRRSE
jgi:hypothetical protein